MIVSRQREHDHGTKVFEESRQKSWSRDARAQVRHVEERSVGPQGQEPQAGDRDRSVPGTRRRGEGAEEAQGCEKTQGEAVRSARSSPRLAMPRGRSLGFASRTAMRGPMARRGGGPLRRGSPALQALLEGVHEVDDVARPLFPLDSLDRLARGLAADQRLQGRLIFVLEFRGIEVIRLGVEDVACELDHVLCYFRTSDAVEIILLVAQLVGISQGGAEQAIAERLDRDDMFAG